MRKNLKYNLFLIFLFFFLVLGVNSTFAALRPLEITYPSLPGGPPAPHSDSPPEEYINYFFYFIILASGVIALGSLVYAGIRYLTSTGKPEAMALAREQLSATVFGILILLSAYLLLKVLSPQFLNLGIQPITPPAFEPLPAIAPPPNIKIDTSIDTEIPLGRLIEGRIFERYVSDVPFPDPTPQPGQPSPCYIQPTPQPSSPPPAPTRQPRLLRIKNNTYAIFQLTQWLWNNSHQLRSLIDQCTCLNNMMDPNKEPKPCCFLNNPGPGCTNNNCNSKPRCTSDPCKEVRSQIQNKITDNLNIIYLGKQGILQYEIGPDGKERLITVTTSLNEEIKKALSETRDLKMELKRLERAEQFIENCAWRNLNSFNRFLTVKEKFCATNWTMREIRVWDDINIVYRKRLPTYPQEWQSFSWEQVYDFATFYCAFSGTLEENYPFPTDALAPAEQALREQQSLIEADEAAQFMACSGESPVGEIIDRSKKIGYKIVERIEKMAALSKDMIKEIVGWVADDQSEAGQITHTPIEGNAVNTDGLQVWVSQCSSQRCYSQCICSGCDWDDVPTCIGPNCVCGADDCNCLYDCCPCTRSCIVWQGQYPEGPCPKTEIEQNLQKIKDLFEGVPRGELRPTDRQPKQKEGIRDVYQAPIPDISLDWQQEVYHTELEGPTPTRQEPLRREQVGIMPILDETVLGLLEDLRKYYIKQVFNEQSPGLLEDLDNTTRKSMRVCTTPNWYTSDVLLANCAQAERSTTPTGELIKACCDPERKQGGAITTTPFGVCLGDCYLQVGQADYRKCLTACLTRDAGILNERELAWCFHRLNFYCCHVR